MYAILSDIVLTKQNNYFISLQLKLNVVSLTTSHLVSIVQQQQQKGYVVVVVQLKLNVMLLKKI